MIEKIEVTVKGIDYSLYYETCHYKTPAILEIKCSFCKKRKALPKIKIIPKEIFNMDKVVEIDVNSPRGIMVRKEAENEINDPPLCADCAENIFCK